MYHLLICPALSREHIQLNEELNHKLRGWSVPYSAIKPSSRESQLRTKWYHAARRIFPFEEISDSRLSLLTKGFWKSNQYKQCISTRAFMENLANLLRDRANEGKGFPVLSSKIAPRNELLVILRQELTLQTHCLTDPLHFSPLFAEWMSSHPCGSAFG